MARKDSYKMARKESYKMARKDSYKMVQKESNKMVQKESNKNGAKRGKQKRREKGVNNGSGVTRRYHQRTLAASATRLAFVVATCEYLSWLEDSSAAAQCLRSARISCRLVYCCSRKSACAAAASALCRPCGSTLQRGGAGGGACHCTRMDRGNVTSQHEKKHRTGRCWHSLCA